MTDSGDANCCALAVLMSCSYGSKELGRFLVQCGSVAQSPGGGRLRDPSILIFKILCAGRGKKIIVEFKNTQNCENTNVHTMYLFDVMSSSLKNS